MTIRRFPRRVDRLLHGTNGPVGVRLQIAGINVESGAKRRCPVDTGRLRSSIRTTNVFRPSAQELSVRIGSNVHYARHVELGTRYMRARPCLRPALEEELR